MDYLPIGIIVFAIANAIFTVYFVNRASKEAKNTLEGLGLQLNTGLQQIEEQIAPVIQASSRAMGAISHLSDDTKMDKALERRIGQDLMGKNADVLELIQMAFPRVSEYIEEHPEAITKLLPRLNTLMSDPETRKRLNLQVGGKTSDLSRFWAEERD